MRLMYTVPFIIEIFKDNLLRILNYIIRLPTDFMIKYYIYNFF